MRKKVLLIGGNSLVGQAIASGVGATIKSYRQRGIMLRKTDIN